MLLEEPMTIPTQPKSQRGGFAGGAVDDSKSEQLIKSRQRVKAHGEVFTPRRMVNQMLDLVKPE